VEGITQARGGKGKTQESTIKLKGGKKGSPEDDSGHSPYHEKERGREAKGLRKRRGKVEPTGKDISRSPGGPGVDF